MGFASWRTRSVYLVDLTRRRGLGSRCCAGSVARRLQCGWRPAGEACALLRIARQQFRLEISKLCPGMGNTDVRVRGTGHVSITSAIQRQAERGDPLEAQVPQCARGLADDAQRYGLRPRSA